MTRRRRARPASGPGCTRAGARRSRAGTGATRSRERPRSRARRGERGREHERAIGGQLAARDRPVALDRMRRSSAASRRSLTRYAALEARAVRDEDRRGLGPARRVAELRREHDPGEEQQVLRPLPRAQRDERGTHRTAARPELDDRRALAAASRLAREDELERRAAADLGVELDPAAERLRELVRDRRPRPGAAAVARPERPEDPLLLVRRDPGPGVRDVTATSRSPASARARCGRRRASSGTRSTAGS